MGDIGGFSGGSIEVELINVYFDEENDMIGKVVGNAPYAVSPKYESTEHFFVVTLPNVKWTGETADAAASEMSDKHDGVNVGENDGATLSPTQRKVLEHLRENGALSAADLANAIGKTQRTVERALAELKAKGFLARVGSDKTGYWNVLK